MSQQDHRQSGLHYKTTGNDGMVLDAKPWATADGRLQKAATHELLEATTSL